MEDGDAVMGQPLPSSDCPDEDYEDWDQLDESLFNADNLNLLPDAVELPAPVTEGGGELARTRSDPPASRSASTPRQEGKQGRQGMQASKAGKQGRQGRQAGKAGKEGRQARQARQDGHADRNAREARRAFERPRGR